MEKGTCFLLAVHGSGYPGARESASRFEEALRLGGLGHPVHVCFLRVSEPSFSSVLDSATRSGAKRIVVVPLFVFPGQHLAEEIPGLVEEFQSTHPGVVIKILPALAELPGFVRWVTELIREQGTAADPVAPGKG